MANEITQLTKQLQELRGSQESIRTEAFANDNKAIRLVSGMQMTIKRSNSTIASLNSEVDSLKDENSANAQKITQQNSLIQSTADKQKRLIAVIGEIQNSIKKINKQIKLLEQNMRTGGSTSVLEDVADALSGGKNEGIFKKFWNSLGKKGKIATSVAGGAALVGGGALAYNALSNKGNESAAPVSAPPAGNNLPDLTAQSNIKTSTYSGDNKQILATIRKRESSNNYQAKAKTSSASGAYQFIDGTWQSLTKKFGIGTEFKRAGDAPPEIQDRVADLYISQILKENNNDISAIPKVWYTGNAQGRMSAKALAANNGLTAEKYAEKWMGEFGKQQPSDGKTADAAKVQNPQQVAGISGADIPANSGQRRSEQGGNGNLPDSALESIGGNHKLQPAAAAAYKKMVAAAQKDGVVWTITDSYRPLAVQERLAKEKGLYSQGGLAARPGTSNHGWGTALDLGGGANKLDTKQNNWLQQHAAEFGFKTIPREPWHWEFKGGGIDRTPGNGSTVGGGISAARQEANAPRGLDGDQVRSNMMSGMGIDNSPMGQMMSAMNTGSMVGGMFGGRGAAIGGLLGVGASILSSLMSDDGKKSGRVVERGPDEKVRAIQQREIDKETAAEQSQQQQNNQQSAEDNDQKQKTYNSGEYENLSAGENSIYSSLGITSLQSAFDKTYGPSVSTSRTNHT
jgi:LAS superfamily LD-carboxypeptidase LdcB/uncharacterized protein YoxC